VTRARVGAATRARVGAATRARVSAAQLPLFAGWSAAAARADVGAAAAPLTQPAVDPDEAAARAALENRGELVLRAGAGTGKTHTLVAAVVHLVGTRRIAPARVLMLTFSEKAAAEMRARVRHSFEERGWRAEAAALGTAPIATFHGFAAGLLRRHAAAARLDPGFRLLDEDEAAALVRARAEGAVLAALDADRPQIRELVRELDYSRGVDSLSRGLVEHVVAVAERLREEGRTAAVPTDDLAAARQAFAAARLEYAVAVQELLTALGGARRDALEARGPELERTLHALDPAADPLAQPLLAAIQRQTKGNLGNVEGRRAAQLALRAAEDGLREAHVAFRAGPLEAAFLGLVEAVLADYGRSKAALGALDFADLIAEARALLERDEAVRGVEQARHDAVLIDELQDTNEQQDELARLVRAPGAPLLAVGDPKQSIYEFRGADVAVFERVEARVRAAGGQALALVASRRARAPLLELINRLFARAMRGGGRAFEIGFDPARDALRAHRGGEGVGVEILGAVGGAPEAGDAVADEAGDAEPGLVARHIRDLVVGRRQVVYGEGERPRPARWGDIALLLRRFTHLDAFLAELRRAGVPHYVVNGRGFYEAQEVRDLVHALTLLDDPGDDLALLGVLRSPLVALSDASLLQLGTPLRLRPLLVPGFAPPADVPAGEAARLTAFLALYRRLVAQADRLGAGGVLRALVDATDLTAVLATTFYGEQKVANLEQLLDLAARHDEDGRGDRRAFVRRLRAHTARERSLAPPAQILGEKEDVVRVMTVHQSKGLEFPVVFVPECGAAERDEGGPLVYDREAGLGMKLRLGDERLASPRARAGEELRAARARAESTRLFYVAATRARDLLVLSGTPRRGAGACWRQHLDALLAEDPEARALVREVLLEAHSSAPARSALVALPPAATESGPAPAPAPGPTSMDDVATDAEIRQVARTGLPAATPASLLVAPATELQDFAACPRRYHLKHEVGLDEHPVLLEVAAPDDDDQLATTLVTPEPEEALPAGGRLSAAERGTLAHRLLERVDLAAWRTRKIAALDELLAAEGRDPHDPEVAEVRQRVAAFLDGPYGLHLATRPADSLLREVPFALAVDGAGGLRLLVKGQIDLVVFDGPTALTVLDYKFVREASGTDYRFQLLTYAAAARALWGRKPRVGVVHLRERVPVPQLVDVRDDELDACLARVGELGDELARAQKGAAFAGRELATCRALRCGYLHRCHGPGAVGAPGLVPLTGRAPAR
jgi:ATP-dependent helicase/nuclease subunit A